MFSKSGTNTPNPSSSINKIQYHEQLDETITWIKDWYSPNLSTDPLSQEDAMNDAVRLKGWYKTNINHKNSKNQLTYNPVDTLDLNQWRYYKEIDNTSTNIDNDSSTNETNDDNMEIDKELGSAIRFDDQFS
ncbi:uncharacterized protein J8A68_001149 [[Candida] subhashii]|uniref:Uncharacterized protein n=1 Tax=[Candida] subhashii TaxID=561895 RepID=A0A8J5URD7_9ASCO|nr:uncharacterized protein J8A68_001149 [[Candida] subhashii]KAG7665461.1 hypothetical protein J8A68_001149 [[Candida] subhashii]